MTDNERDMLEQLSPEERAERLARKESFSLGNKHLDIICNYLLPDSDANNIKLGKILRDLVAFNVDGTTELLDNCDKKDTADASARRLLLDDAVQFQNAWLLRSIRNTNNRKGKTKAPSEQPEEEPRSVPEEGYPTIDAVREYATMELGGVDTDTVAEIVRQWYDNMTKSHWHDERGNSVRDWRKVFKAYATKAWIDKANDKL